MDSVMAGGFLIGARGFIVWLVGPSDLGYLKNN